MGLVTTPIHKMLKGHPVCSPLMPGMRGSTVWAGVTCELCLARRVDRNGKLHKNVIGLEIAGERVPSATCGVTAYGMLVDEWERVTCKRCLKLQPRNQE